MELGLSFKHYHQFQGNKIKNHGQILASIKLIKIPEETEREPILEVMMQILFA